MDFRLARFDVCVESPVGSLDDQKKRDIVFENTPLDCWIGKKKQESLLFLACWMDSELVKSDICVEKPVGWLDGSKKNGSMFFFWPVGWLDDQPGLIYVWKDLLDGWMTKKNGT